MSQQIHFHTLLCVVTRSHIYWIPVRKQYRSSLCLDKMYVYNRSLEESLSGLTSRPYHILMWIFLSSGILGNILVLFWRLSKKELRYSILSLLIVSLAAADLLWCFHFLIQEAMLFRPLFLPRTNDNESFSFDGSNRGLCLAITFLTYVSCGAAMLTAVAIAMHTFCALLCNRHQRLIVIYTILSWTGAVSVAAAALVVRWTNWYDPNQAQFREPMPLNLFSLTIVYGCIAMDEMLLFPVVVTTVIAVSSLVIVAIYFTLCIRLGLTGNGSSYQNSEVTTLKIRLGVIAVINVVGWWPTCIIYWYAFLTNTTVFNGKLAPSYTEIPLLLTAAVSAVNPVIYSVKVVRICRVVLRVFGFSCTFGNGDKRDRNVTDTGDHSTRLLSKTSCCCCVSGCCSTRRYPYRMSSLSDSTQEESLFPE